MKQTDRRVFLPTMWARTPAPLVAAILALAAGPATAQPDDPDAADTADTADAAPGSTTPEAATMSLGQVLQVAVRQQPALARAGIDVEVADAAVLQAAGVDDWVFDTTGSWLSVRSQGIDPSFGAPYQAEQAILRWSANLTRSFSTGGTLAVTAQASRNDQQVTVDFMGTDIQNDTLNYQTSLSASYNQPLLAGRGSEVARARNRQLAISRDAAELAYRAAAIEAVQQVIGAYWELAYARRDLEIRRNSLDLAQQRLRNTRIAISAGSVAATEALAVEQIIALREEEALQSELTISRRSLDLRRLAGLEIGPSQIDLAIDGPLGVTPTPTQFDIDELLGRALAHNADVATLTRLAEGAEIDVAVTENGLLPELDLGLTVGPSGSSDGFGESLEQTATFDNYSVGASLTYRHAFGRRAARGAHRSARAELRRQKMDLTELRAVIASNLVLAIKQAQTAQKRVALAQRAIDLAEQNIEAEQSRFELGRATNFDVLERQDELEQAQLRKARAAVDYLAAVAAVDAITGDILAKYGIAL